MPLYKWRVFRPKQPLRESVTFRPAPKLARWLASQGFVPDGNEGLAETMAMAFGWSMGELRTAMLRRAAGLPV